MVLVEWGWVLCKVVEILREKNYEFFVLEMLDIGKLFQEMLIVDVVFGVDCLEYYGGLVVILIGEYIDLGGLFVYIKCELFGICFGIGVWNYLIQIVCWKVVLVFVCGNVMIFKLFEVILLSVFKLVEVLFEVGFFDGVFNVFQGFGDVGVKFVVYLDIVKVLLIGLVLIGVKVVVLVGENLKKIMLELGGKFLLIIFDDVDIENVIFVVINVNFYFIGQICFNGMWVFVYIIIKEQFLI